METLTTFQEAKVGDKVWYKRYGWGEIVDVNYLGTAEWGDKYPIRVRFPGIFPLYACFTYNGQFWDYETQTLFWDEVEIPTRPVVRNNP